MPHILIIDDDVDILRMLKLALTRNGFNVTMAASGLDGLRRAYEAHPDAIILDVMMPMHDGFEICRRLREMTEVPIIFLTAKGTVDDIVRGLALGADDYVAKPFNEKELVSRLVACLRRAANKNESPDILVFTQGAFVLDRSRRHAVVNGTIVHLTPTEFQVLDYLVRHAGKVLSRDAILTRVWGPEYLGETELVKQFIYRLRQKIEAEPRKPHFIHTVPSTGYFFDAEEPT
ncbi:MAG: response regulator transcription factor [Chloroflexota bacterium]|nr:response regulator transcription factor [Chloroflexota bacterium]